MEVAFPITYNSIPYAIALSNQGTTNTDYASAYSDLTQSSVYLADNKNTVHFIALGIWCTMGKGNFVDIY